MDGYFFPISLSSINYSFFILERDYIVSNYYPKGMMPAGNGDTFRERSRSVIYFEDNY